MDGGTAAQRGFVKNLFLWHWARFVDLKIDFVDNFKPSDIRVSIKSLSTPDHDPSDRSLGGSWIGTEARYYGDEEKTMFVKIENNPEISTNDQGTVLHEIGHSLALHHSHQRSDRPFGINENVAYNFFMLNPGDHGHARFIEIVLSTCSITIYFTKDPTTGNQSCITPCRQT